MFVARPIPQLSSLRLSLNQANEAGQGAAPEVDVETREDGWDATGVLVFATSLLSLGGSAVMLLLRVTGLLG
jgi:hypothetical protein